MTTHIVVIMSKLSAVSTTFLKFFLNAFSADESGGNFLV